MTAFACGSDRSPTDTAPLPAVTTAAAAGDVPTNIVSNADIRATKPQTPQRTIMTWAQAVQFGDVTAVRESYTERVRKTVPRARLEDAAGRIGSLLGHPQIVATFMRGPDLALARVGLVSYAAGGRSSTQPTTFRLRRENGRWLLDDARLLLDTAAALRRVTP
ncbi:MAG: hypothetical protein QOE31_2719 [Solirubrobacteraceae bacterium]|nr:hypothetical protein [Solirubrobacteraceae bacterium]